jgi:hypothetical protein
VEMQSDGSRVSGDDVTLYFTCGTRQSPSGCGTGSDGGFMEGSRAGVTLGSPYFGGFSLLYDPGNTSKLELKVSGDSDSQSFGGAIYARSADMVLEHGSVLVSAPVVVGSLELEGGEMDFSVHAPGLASAPGPREILLTK